MLKYFISSLLAALLIVVAFVNTPSAHAQVSPGAQSLIIPINRAVFVPCANNGQGEVVAFSGNEHLTSNFIITGGGVLFNHIVLQANFQGVTGVGQTTGDKYQGVEVEKQTFNRPG